MKKILCLVGLLMLSGCVTNSSYETISADVRKVNVEENGKMVFSHYEMRDKDLNLWFEADEKSGVWAINETGKNARRVATKAPGGC